MKFRNDDGDTFEHYDPSLNDPFKMSYNMYMPGIPLFNFSPIPDNGDKPDYGAILRELKQMREQCRREIENVCRTIPLVDVLKHSFRANGWTW